MISVLNLHFTTVDYIWTYLFSLFRQKKIIFVNLRRICDNKTSSCKTNEKQVNNNIVKKYYNNNNNDKTNLPPHKNK